MKYSVLVFLLSILTFGEFALGNRLLVSPEPTIYREEEDTLEHKRVIPEPTVYREEKDTLPNKPVNPNDTAYRDVRDPPADKPISPEPPISREERDTIAYNSVGGTLDGRPLSETPVCTNSTAYCRKLRQWFRQGLAAGNLNDWYENRDNGHSLVNLGDLPQVNISTNSGHVFGVSVRRYPGRNVIGNASLAFRFSRNMLRYRYNSSSFHMDLLYNHYRDNNHFWYPSADDFKKDAPRDFDERYSMSLYESSSLGRSGSDKNHVRKFFIAMAALRPQVKDMLERNGLLIPTIQMIYRRSRMNSDAAYLSRYAHRSAYNDQQHYWKLIHIANAILPSNIPAFVELKVAQEDFIGEPDPLRLFTDYTEHLYTTPQSVARTFRQRGIQEKTMIVDLNQSFDLNNRELSFHHRILRGSANSVKITKLNPRGTRLKITFIPRKPLQFGFAQRTSSLFIVGFFAHNGAHYSAPAFLTVMNDPGLKELNWNADKTQLNLVRSRRWLSGVFHRPEWSGEKFQFSKLGQLLSFSRDVDGFTEVYNRYGLLEAQNDKSKVRVVSYSDTIDIFDNGSRVTNVSDHGVTSSFSERFRKATLGQKVNCGSSVRGLHFDHAVISKPVYGKLLDVGNGVFTYHRTSPLGVRDHFLIESTDTRSGIPVGQKSVITACSINLE